MEALAQPAALALADLAAGSRAAIGRALHRVAALLSAGEHTPLSYPWPSLSYGQAVALKATLASRYAPATTNLHLSALRAVVRHARRLGQLDEREAAAILEVENLPNHREPAGRALPPAELAALLHVARAQPHAATAARDAALVALLFGAGVRRAELVRLELADYAPLDATLRVRHGKGDRERTVPLPPGTVRALETWRAVRGDVAGALLCRVSKAGVIGEGIRSGEAIRARLGQLVRAAGVGHTTPHDLRRTLATEYLDAGVDAITVAAILGHRSTDTTRRYDRRPLEARKRAAQLIHVP